MNRFHRITYKKVYQNPRAAYQRNPLERGNGAATGAADIRTMVALLILSGRW